MDHGDADLNRLTERIIGCAIEVHRAMGPGLLESVYRSCLRVELRRQGITYQADRPVPLRYRGVPVDGDLKVDLLVEGLVVVELKAVERIHPIHLAQVITYLKLTGRPLGLLLNFNATTLRAGLRRLEHPSRYVVKRPKSPDQDFVGKIAQETKRSESS